MALINDIYVWVETEDIERSSSIPQHPVEKGLPISDNARNEPKSIRLSGKIVDVGNTSAADIISKIEKLRTSGSLITYKGRNIGGNFMIKSFPTTHSKDNWGGADFTMDLVEVRIAKSAYDENKQKKQEAEKKKTNPTLEVGAIVVFTGGSV